MDTSLLDIFARQGELVAKDVSPWQTFAGKGMKFRLQSYDWDGCACVSYLTMRAFCGLMKMESLICTPYNKELMQVFHDVEMVEALGSGMPRVLQKYGRECFVFMHNFIRIVIPFQKDENGLENVTENVLENKTQLSERQIKIIELLIATGEHNVVENVVENVAENSATLSKILDVSERTIQRDLAQLQELGHIRHVGPDKGGRWQVLKTINNKK